ncbi:MAG: DUF481 domain-containing protein [Pseudomonadota bacterium]
MRNLSGFSTILGTLAALLLGPALRAQVTAAPPPVATAAPADAKAKPTEKAQDPAQPADQLSHESQVSLAAFFTAGNVSSLAGKLGGYYQLRYSVHGLRVEGGGGVTGIAQDTNGDLTDGFEVPLDKNFNTLGSGKLRYDFFITESDSAYTSALAVHDSAANLELRMRAELGYRRLFLHEKKHALTAELGAVYTIDRAPFDGDTNGDGKTTLADTSRFEDTNGVGGARVLVSYTNALSDNLAFIQTLEVVTNIWPDVEAPFEQSRVDAAGDNKLGPFEATTFASSSAVNLSMSQNLAVGFNLTFLWDNAAIARRNAYQNYDVATNLVLAYKFF